MASDIKFLPREHILSLEELASIAKAFVALGVTKIRVTGGEPLVRRNVISLFQQLGQLEGLEELTLTSNGSQLSKLAPALFQSGVKRINISLDSLQPGKFARLTRTGQLEQVLAGIDSAIDAGFERIKLNAVILKGRNDDEIIDLVEFARRKKIDISFIEEMPLGHIDEHNRALSFCSSDEVRQRIAKHYPLTACDERTGGPSRYYRFADSDTRVGFISPHSHNFCDQCNRVRVTAEGRLLLCLGNEHSVDLRAVLREHPGDISKLQQTLIDAMAIKPERHHFELDETPQIVRFMNMTGG
jgi:cyclic pyranopterin phosphate synthase